MPTPAVVWSAEALSCGRLHVRADARRSRHKITVDVDGVTVAVARGHVAWTGQAFATSPLAVVTVDGEQQTVDGVLEGSIELSLERQRPTISSSGAPRALPVSAKLSTHSLCASPELTWTIHDGSIDGPVIDSSPAAIGTTHRKLRLDVGEHHVVAALRWRDRVIATSEGDVTVLVSCVDADKDGLCGYPPLPRDSFWRFGQGEQYDCDEQDPFVRPGLPDLAGDGRDNDCDAPDWSLRPWRGPVRGGDRDGDGVEGPERPAPTAEERSAIAATLPPELAEQMARAPRGAAPLDCDDSDPTVFPGAPETRDGRDHDCDGEPGARRDTEVRLVERFERLAGPPQAAPPPTPQLELWDGERWRNTGDLPAYKYVRAVNISSPLVRRLQPPTGHDAWLVVVSATQSRYWRSEGSSSRYLTRTCRDGLVLVEEGRSGLVNAGTLDLGCVHGWQERAIPAKGQLQGAVIAEGTFAAGWLAPIVSREGVDVGERRYRWDGDRLVSP